MEFRRPKPDEARLLRELVQRAGFSDPDTWVGNLRVRDMSDGGMGSLQFERTPSQSGEQAVISCLASLQFTDADGVEVIASLYVDQEGVPVELDMWKTNFAKLVRIPSSF